MTILPIDATDDAILDVVRRWVDALAEKRFDDAFKLVARNEWTNELLEMGLLYEFNDGVKGVLTRIAETHGGLTPRHEVTRSDFGPDSEYFGDVWFDLPMNNEWSDLTALFNIVRSPVGLHLELETIHIM